MVSRKRNGNGNGALAIDSVRLELNSCLEDAATQLRCRTHQRRVIHVIGDLLRVKKSGLGLVPFVHNHRVPALDRACFAGHIRLV